MLRRFSLVVMSVALILGRTSTAPVYAATGDIVLYSSDVTNVIGNWTKTSNSFAAGGQQLTSVDKGWSTPDSPLASPADYFEATFNAPSATTYHVWLRLRGTGDSK